MRQRLGVAAALLKDPELLVLDEPSNGLDPAGQQDMRALIGQLGAEGPHGGAVHSPALAFLTLGLYAAIFTSPSPKPRRPPSRSAACRT